jgi:hypothetical protein
LDTPGQPYMLELAERFYGRYDQYAHRDGQPFTLVAVLNPGNDPAIDAECGSMFRIQFPDGQMILAWPEEIGRHIT